MRQLHPLLGILIVLVSFFLLELCMWYIDESLLTISEEVIENFSENWESTTIAKIIKWYNYYGFIIINALCAGYVLASGPKIAQMLWVNSLSLGITLSALLGAVYHKLRPSWKKQSIPILRNHEDYGYPSFSVTIAGCIMVGTLLLYLSNNFDFCLNDLEKNMLKKTRSSFIYFPALKIAITFLALILYSFLVFSEIYIGSHTIGQVLHGLFLSLLCVCIPFVIFRISLGDYYKTVLSKPPSLRQSIIILIVISFTIALVGGVIYGVMRGLDIKIDEEYIQHIREEIPGFTANTPLNTALIHAGLGFLAIGAHLGLLLFPVIQDIDPIQISAPTSFVFKIIRLIFVLFMILPLPFVAIIFLSFSPVTLLVWFKSVIPSAFFGFFYFFMADSLMKRLGLLPKAEGKDKGNKVAPDVIAKEVKIDSSRNAAAPTPSNETLREKS